MAPVKRPPGNSPSSLAFKGPHCPTPIDRHAAAMNSWFTPIALLTASNVFMTFAWYGHLKHQDVALWKVILASWGIAFFEYCLMVPANRWGVGSGNYTAMQLKIAQEAITLIVFCIFAIGYLGERLRWNHYAACLLVIGAVLLSRWPENAPTQTDARPPAPASGESTY